MKETEVENKFGHHGNKSFTRPSRPLRGFLEEPTVEHRPSWRPDPARPDPAGDRTQLLARMNSWCVEAALHVHQLHVSTTDDVDVDGMKC